MIGRLATRPLLSPEETRLAEEVRGVLREIKFRGKIIFKTQPAAFIDPDKIPKTDGRQNALYTGIIALAIIDRPKAGKVAFVVIDISSPLSREIESLFVEFGVPVFVGSIGGDFSDLKDRLRSELIRNGARTSTKCLTNKWERWVMTLTDQSLGRSISPHVRNDLPTDVAKLLNEFSAKRRRKLLLFHEPALSAILAADETQCRLATVDYRYLQNSRLDLLVTSSPPEYAPLLALEFDGPTHQTAEGRRKDAKKEKILAAALIPLLRISFHDAPPLKDTDIVDISAHRISTAKQRILAGLIQRCIDLQYRERVEVPADLQRHFASVASRYRNAISGTRKKTASIHLDEHECVHVKNLIKQLTDELDTFELEEAAERHAQLQMREYELDPQHDASLNESGSSLEGFMYHSDEVHGLSCSVRVRHGPHQEVVQSPGVRYRCLGFSGFDFEEVLREELRLWVKQDVVERVAPKMGKIFSFQGWHR